MPLSFVNPYKGSGDDEEETCSVSFASMAGNAKTADKQTEAQFNKAKLMGEWGVLKGKLNSGEIPDGTKVLTFDGKNSHGFIYVKSGKFYIRRMSKITTGHKIDTEFDDGVAKAYFDSSSFKWSIPSTVKKADQPLMQKLTGFEPGTKLPNPTNYWSEVTVAKNDGKLPAGTVVAENETYSARLVWNGYTFAAQGYDEKIDKWEDIPGEEAYDYASEVLFLFEGGWATPKAPATPSAPQVASPTPKPSVGQGSTSKGSMTDEDVAAMFVQVKDQLAKEKGLNIKGANPDLDALVHKAIGDETGYTAAEVKAKIESYKATGKKLSALKKKVLKSGAAKPADKPNDVPTEADKPTLSKVTTVVTEKVEAKPTQVYSDEDIAAAYVIAKDKIVAESNGKWTLYSKSDEMDGLIYIEIFNKTGYNSAAAKHAIAQYLSTPGKKLSTLKKSLVKQGKLKPEADTLKSSKAKAAPSVKADVDAKASDGHSPTPAPTMDKPKPSASDTRAAAEAGDISGFSEDEQKKIYDIFKSSYSGKYLSDTPAHVYDNLIETIAKYPHDGDTPVTPLQVLRVVDAYGAKKFGVENGNLFEKKVVEFLTTPAGKKHVEDSKLKAIKAAEEAKKAAELAKLAKELQDNQPALPPDSALFDIISIHQAQDMQRSMTLSNPWTDRQQRDLRHYTGSNYHAMNGYLRGIQVSISDRDKNAIKGAQEGMRPSTRAILVHRGMGLDGLGLKDENLIWGLTGKTLEDKGFLSTSVGGAAAFGGKIKLEIECPVGTPMAFVKSISHFSSENEMLLAHGLKYKVLRVDRKPGTWGGTQFTVRVRIVL